MYYGGVESRKGLYGVGLTGGFHREGTEPIKRADDGSQGDPNREVEFGDLCCYVRVDRACIKNRSGTFLEPVAPDHRGYAEEGSLFILMDTNACTGTRGREATEGRKNTSKFSGLTVNFAEVEGRHS